MAYQIIEQEENQTVIKLKEEGWQEVMRFENQFGKYVILQKKKTP